MPSAYSLPVECLQFVQAPMVGISDLPFRLLTSRWGATLTYTQMLHSSALINDRDFLESTLLDLELGKKLREQSGGPRVVAQLAGDDPDKMGRAGRLLIGLVDALEINLGCPQRRAKEGHYGGYLLNIPDLPLITSLTNSLHPLPLPLHLKIRLPTLPLTLPTLLKHLISTTHVSVLTLHCRPIGTPTRRRTLKGLRTEAVGEARELVDGVLEGLGRRKEEVSVVGNGGVQTWEDLERLTKGEGVEGWMVGEELGGNPRFFTSSSSSSSSSLPLNPLSLATEYLDLVDLCSQASTPLSNIKRHLRNFVEGDLGCARTKWCKPFLSDLDACEGLEDVRRVVEGEEVVEAWGSRDRNVAALLEYTS
ncbi:hypothetical protein BDY24DRAFT_133571 [Mrakia frigida]|uniref:tRNA-dihydrouridine synthase family protein n=1 Tax=Mrakia frigida TaxID=29902 RepID=UPI003FCC23D5